MVCTTAAELNASQEIPLEKKWDYFLDNGGWAVDDDYLSVMKRLGSVDTIQEFWNYHNGMERSMKKICSQPSLFSLRLFRNDVKPIWEDDNNRWGGKWVIPCSTMDPTSLWSLWQEISMLAVGGTFARKGAICGCILSYRQNGRKEIHIWVDRTPVNLKAERDYLHSKLNVQALPYFRPHDRNLSKVDTRVASFGVQEGSDEESARSAKSSPQSTPTLSPSNTPIRLSPQFGIRVIV